MEERFIENALNVMKFDLSDKDKELIQFVNMREYAVATQEKPLLFTVGLQSCIGLIAYTKNFSFLAHMNAAKGNWDKDFEIDETNQIGRCKKIETLYREILKNKDKIMQTINIGLVLGVQPFEKDYISRRILEKDLLDLFERLRENNVWGKRIPDISSFSFILDSRVGQIIHDGVENQNKITDIVQDKNKTDMENLRREIK